MKLIIYNADVVLVLPFQDQVPDTAGLQKLFKYISGRLAKATSDE